MKQSDLEKLSKQELVELVQKLKKRKKFGLVWEEKSEDVVEQCKKELPVLEEVTDKVISKFDDGTSNLIIEGDNYHALSVLNYTHAGKIDVICIDPPYNTGSKDFKYNDRYVDKNDTFRHSKWLSFMSKRLLLAKNLLKEKGAIFINIDSNELTSLKMLCDEIFTENNYVGILIWRKKEGGGQTDDYFVTEHEYILVYARSNAFEWIDEIIPQNGNGFTESDERGRFKGVKLAKWGNGARKADRPTMHFPIKSPKGKKVYPIAPDGSEGRWRVGKKRMELLIEEDLIVWRTNKENVLIPYEKIYFEENEVKTIKERSILFDLATTATGTNQLTKIFNTKDVFENPKPTELIKFFIDHSSPSEGLILDFFAGSGTTAHAVLELNKEDGGNRKFILCTNNENGIAEEVCYPRVKKVIEGYADVEGIPANLRYFKTAFVSKSRVSDDTRRALVKRSTEMICVKEDTFQKVTDNKHFKIFKNDQCVTGVLFNLDEMDKFKEKLKETKLPCHIYVFSLTNDAFDEEFSDLKLKHRLCPIPESILEVYRKLFKD